MATRKQEPEAKVPKEHITFYLPPELNRKVRIRCAERGLSLTSYLCSLLEEDLKAPKKPNKTSAH